MATPYVTVVLESAGSTQDEARKRSDSSGEPVLVVASSQTAGRGRKERTWLNAPRALASSMAIRPRWPADTWPRLTLVAGLAVRASIMAVTGIDVGLKWPNDLVVDDRKVGGILAESRGAVVVVGCGLNLWWPHPPAGIGGLCEDDPGPDLGERLAAGWAAGFLASTARHPDEWGRDEYVAACVTLGRAITWEPCGAGEAIDVTADGALVVATGGGELTLSSAEVRTVRGATVPPDTGAGTGGR